MTQFGAILTHSADTPEGLRHLTAFCQTIQLEPTHIHVGEHASHSAVISALTNNAVRGVDAAALVFAHSMAEELLMDLCQILAEIDPEPWKQKVENRKVFFKDVRTRSERDISIELVEAYLAELRKESIVKKTDVLLSILQPGDISTVIPDFQFNRDALNTVDELRHECAHREIRKKMPDIQDNLSLLGNVVRLFIKIAEEKHGLSLMDSLQQPPPASPIEAAPQPDP